MTILLLGAGRGSRASAAADFDTPVQSGDFGVGSGPLVNTLTMGSNFTAGNSAVVVLAAFCSTSNTTLSLTIGGDAATLVVGPNTNLVNATPQIWFVQSLTGGNNQVVATFSDGTSTNHFLKMRCEEWSPFDASAVDLTATHGTFNTTTPGLAGATATAAQANELAYFGYGETAGDANTTNSATPPSGYSQILFEGAANNVNGRKCAFARRRLTTATTHNPTYTTDPSVTWRTVFATFKITP